MATPLIIGDKLPDGTVFAGLAPDGKQIFAMPTDLDVTVTFNEAAKQVKRLNAAKALGHDDWVIPTREQLRVLQQNQDMGALSGTFNTTPSSNGPVAADYYWSSTENLDVRDERVEHPYPFYVWNIQFWSGGYAWSAKNTYAMSCRPVRIVEAPRP